MSEVKTPEAKPAKEKRYIINVTHGNDIEPKKIFVGANGREFQIERGKDVSVPKCVLEALDNAIMGVSEPDPMDETKAIVYDRKRFPYTVVGIVP